MYFKMMSMDYGIHPTLEHYTCIIGLLGRTGHLEKMLTTIHEMPFDHDLVLLQIVLDACKMWGNIELGELTFTKAAKLVEDNMIASINVCGTDTRMEVYASRR
jgi:pentatricopeptide repeat protein